jgi:D-glycero-alpha-D-manno-heptose-7-phosphate kinase
MIISKTPYRISFCGGGTDIREFYQKETGIVASTTIDKFLYVILRKPLGLVESKFRLNYRAVEFCDTIDQINHPIIRETLRYFKIDHPLEVTTFADIPASTGLGSSSAFAVGLVNGLAGLSGKLMPKSELARIASYIEIDVLKRNIGKQDHYASSFGGLNTFRFNQDESVNQEPILFNPSTKKFLEESSLLFYTGQTRNASEILEKQVKNIEDKRIDLKKMCSQVVEFQKLIAEENSIEKIGHLLMEGWRTKKSLANGITNERVEELFSKGIESGAWGGKLLGAGGGGFLFFLASPEKRSSVRKALSNFLEVKIAFESEGSKIIYYDGGI